MSRSCPQLAPSYVVWTVLGHGVGRALHPGLHRAREAAGASAPRGAEPWPAAEADVAAKLIERLLVDPAFRARFRRNPAEACREAGLDELAQEMQLGAGKAMMTLDMRESKSSLAGVMMAAAMEGVGIMQFAEHVAPHLDDIPEAIGDVLSRVNLPAIGPRRQPVGAARRPPPPPAGAGGGRRRRRDRRRRPAAAGGNGAAPAAAAAPVARR